MAGSTTQQSSDEPRTQLSQCVGRAAEVEHLQQFIAQAQRRGANTFLIEGEPGIGKTRLLAEATRHFTENLVHVKGIEAEGSMPLAGLSLLAVDLNPEVVSEIHELVRGNPMALLALLGTLSAEQRAGVLPIDASLIEANVLDTALNDRIGSLPQGSLDALEGVAQRANSVGAPKGAGAAFARAATLTADPKNRYRREYGAALGFWMAGEPALAKLHVNAAVGNFLETVGAFLPATGITAGLNHTCTIQGTGTVQCWGDNSYGQLGDGTTNDSITPVEVTGITHAVDISAGASDSTCAVLATAPSTTQRRRRPSLL